jgi:uncharacterized protein with HEPN domain
MPRKVGHVIHDILEAIDRVDEVTRGKTFANFEIIRQLCWLVQRAIKIISEVSRTIPDDRTKARSEIASPRVVSATFYRRNIVAFRTAPVGMSLSMNCRA